MADLARLIGKQRSDLRLRQAIVTAAPAGAVCTIRFGDLASTSTADDIPGVRCLASAPIANGDTVWVLQQGGALLVIGKVGVPISAGGGGVTAHGALTGLAADDHPQYATDTDLTNHTAAADPHTGYQKESEKDAASGYAGLDAGGLVPDVRIAATIARDTEVTTAVANHAGAADPHPGYATDGDLTAHAAAADPHAGYQKETEKDVASGYAGLDSGGLVPDAKIAATIARDSEVTASIATHAAAADPHTGYQKESEKDVASGYAGLTPAGRVLPSEIADGTPDFHTAPVMNDFNPFWTPIATADDLTAHAAAADPHTGYQQESTLFDATIPSTSAVGAAGAAGAAATAARRDHVHGRESFATPGVALGAAAAAGSALTPIRSDATIAAFDATTPTTQAFSDAAAVGTAAFAARRDHKHAMPADPVVAHAAAADPHTGYQKESEKATANGYAGLDAGAKVPVAQLGGGTASTTTFLRGDQSWGTPAVTGGHTHDGTGGATSLVVGGTAEAGATIPVASTVGAIAMGDYANAGTGTNPIAVGSGLNALNAPQATGAGSICLGANTATTATVGSDEGPRASGPNAIAMGSSAHGRPAAAATGDSSIAIGFAPQAVFTDCIALGSLSIAGTATKPQAIAVGLSAKAQASASIAIGTTANANFDNSVAIGPHSTAYAANQINLCGAGSPVSSVSTLRLQQPCLATAPVDAEICASAFTVWCNEASNVLTFRVKYAGGTLKTGTLALV